MESPERLKALAAGYANLKREGDEVALLRVCATLDFLKSEEAPNYDPEKIEYRVVLKTIRNNPNILSAPDQELFRSLDEKDLVRYCLTGTFSDYDSFVEFESHYPTERWKVLSEIYICFYVKDRIDHEKYVKESEALQLYKSLPHDEALMMKDSEFKQIYSAVNSIKLSRECFKFPPKIEEAIDSLRNHKIPDNDIFELIVMLNQHEPDYDEVTEMLNKYEIPMSERKKLVRGIATSTDRALTPIACWKYQEKNDVPVENSLVYNTFFSTVDITKHPSELILFPSSNFLRKLNLDSVSKSLRITLVVARDEIARAYEYSFGARSNLRFISYRAFKAEVSNLLIPLDYENVLIFGNQLQRKIRNDILKGLAWRLKFGARLVLFNGSDELENKDSALARFMLHDISPLKIKLLPKGIQNSAEPKYKFLLDGRIGGSHLGTTAKVSYYGLDTTGKVQALAVHHVKHEVDLAEVYQNGDTLRGLYRRHLNEIYRKTGAERVAAVPFRFSDELTFYCASRPSDTGYRLEAYAYPPGYADIVQLKKNSDTEEIQEPRIDMRIKGSIKITSSRKYGENQKEYWTLNVYPYESIRERRTGEEKNSEGLKPQHSVRDAIIAEYGDSLGKSITVKTFVYFHPALENGLKKEEIELLRELSGSEMGEQHFPVDSKKIQDIYKEKYETAGEKNSQADAARRILSSVFSLAVEEGYTSNNPLESLPKEEIKDSDLLFTQVRKSPLVKRYFEVDEMTAIHSLCRKEITKGNKIYLGVLLKLFLGLESNVVSGLIWDDFVELKEGKAAGEMVYQLLIRRQVVNDGSDYSPFVGKESYRALCLPDIIRDLLLAEYEKQKEAFSKEVLANKPLIEYTGNKELQNKICPPVKLQKICRQLVKKLHLDEMIIEVPTKGNGTKETNLNDFRGDIFRTNYEHYARTVAMFDPGELAYMMGVKTSITFSNNYCDYGNDISQIILYRKQCRLNRLFVSEKKMAASHVNEKVKCGSGKITFAGGAKNPVMLSGIVQFDGDGLEIKADSPYGVNFWAEEIK